MAGDWIPITVGLTRRREVLQVATETGRSRWEVVGLLVELWTWVTEESQDSVTPGMTRAALCSAIGGDDDFWCAVEHAGWLVFDDSGMTIPHFDRWFGTTSKSRLLCVLRKREQRRRENAARDNGHEEPGQESQDSVTSPQPERREERGELKDDHPSDDLVNATPSKALDLEAVTRWNALAELHGRPKIESITEPRRKALRARLAEHPDLWDLLDAETAHLGAWARGQAFLTFDWVLRPANLAKLLEGNYRERPGESTPTAAARLGRQSSWRDPDKFKEPPHGL